ncbi:MAG: alcohol dehydrogenase catalytic domain-containing protein [Planctomycetota bacterium]
MARPEAGAAVLITDLDSPTPGPGEVRVRVLNTAICGTDRHIYHWDPSVASMITPPVTIGHEFCGHLDEIGVGVDGWNLEDYVSAEMHIVCGRCRACQAGNQHICEKTEIAGLHRAGCFAEYVVVPASNLVRLDPKIVPPHIGSFLDALGNAVHTVQSASSIAGRHVLMSGYGAIGAMAAAVVEFEGAKSLTITEVMPGHLERAKKWAAGLSGRVPISIHDPATEGPDMVESVRQATKGGVDVVIEMSGAAPAIQAGIEMLYPGGEMMQLGIPTSTDLELKNFSQEFIFKGLTWKGILGRRMFATWDEMLSLLQRGLDVEHIVTHRLPMSSFHEGIALLDRGEAHKVVLDPTA